MGSVNTLNTYKIHNMYFTRCSKDYYDNLVANKDASTESLSNETVIINKIQENNLYIVVDDSYVDETSGKVGKVDLYLGYTKLNIDTDFLVNYVDGDHYNYSNIHTIREAIIEVIKNLENEADRQDIKIEEIEKRISEEVSSSIHYRGVTKTKLVDMSATPNTGHEDEEGYTQIQLNDGTWYTPISGDVLIYNDDAKDEEHETTGDTSIGQEFIFTSTTKNGKDNDGIWHLYGDVSDYVLTKSFNITVEALNSADTGLSNRITDEENSRTQADDKIREDFVAADEELNTKIINEVLGDKDDTIANKTLNGVINEVNEINELLNLLEDSNVIVNYPYVTLLSTHVKQQEVGTTITPDYKITFNAGKYEYGPSPTGCTVDTSNGKGWHASFNGELLNSQSGSFSSIIVTDDTDIKLSVYCDYTEGITPKSDLGRDIEKSKIPAGTTEAKTATLSGYRQVFFGSTTSSFNVDGLSIRNINTGEVTKSSEKDFTMTIVDGAKQVLIAVPKNRKITAIEDKNAFGTDILVKFATSTLKVAGADENINSEYARDYTVYIYSPDAALSSNTYTVRLANA